MADRPAASLTLARRKRLELAKSLAMRPRLLMLDEVNAGLNQTEVDDALAIIRKIAEQGVTIIVIEHLMKVVLSISHRLVVLHHGQLIAQGTPREVVNDQRVIEAYLGAQIRRGQARRRCIERRAAKAIGDEPAGRLWRRAGAVGHQPRGRRGRARLHHRLERRRQDHADALPVGTAQADRRQHRRRRQADDGRRTPADFVHAGIAHVPEGRRLFSAMSVRDNLLMGAYLRTDKAAIAADLERVYAMFPILADAPAPGRRHAVRRRAADVRDRARPDGRAEPAADRRTVARPRAARGRAADRKPARRSTSPASPSCWSSRT